MRVKICGLRSPRDAARAVALGATHVGVVLAADSPRRATCDEARAVFAAVAGAAAPVLVFRGDSHDRIVAASDALGVRVVQVHGAGPAARARLQAAGLLPIPVAEVPPDARALPRFERAPDAARPALLDGGRGGAGRRFPWTLLAPRAPDGVFVAGGVRPDNVRALLAHRPWGLDVSSGVERAPGVKDPALLAALFEGVRAAEVLS